jgi:hypothetical protein
VGLLWRISGRWSVLPGRQRAGWAVRVIIGDVGFLGRFSALSGPSRGGTRVLKFEIVVPSGNTVGERFGLRA